MLNATIDPLTAHLMLSTCSVQLEAEARRLWAAGRPADRRAGQLLLAGVAQLRRAARQLPTSEVGSSEVPIGSDSSGWSCPPGSGLTTGEAASELGVSERQVLNLVRDDGPLLGGRRGGRWVIDAESVIEEKTRRSEQHVQ